MKRSLTLLALTLFLTACNKGYWSNGGEGTGIRSGTYPEATPFGMVLIPAGAIQTGWKEPDHLWGTPEDTQWTSFDAFWMDQTEVTNAKYRQFVYWVRDSIIRERLYDPLYGGNELYKITEDRYGEPVKPYLDWNRPIPWNRAIEEEESAIESIYIINPVTGEKILDGSQINYLYEWYDYPTAARYQKELELLMQRRKSHGGMENVNSTVFIQKDTAFFDEKGQIVNQTITRPLSGYYDFLHTRIVNIYPEENCWTTDFPEGDTERYSRLYFNHPDYDNYPVAGVSWEMATAFCIWRTALFRQSNRLPTGQHIEPFRLPTEAEWEYAARSGKVENIYPWGNKIEKCHKGCFPANFKQAEGVYTGDGHLVTSRVRLFPPNEFGLYDMAGNVAEWTSTVSEDDKRVIKGGSWKDLPHFIRSDIRSFEQKDTKRSYIGFRCVRSYAGVPGRKR